MSAHNDLAFPIAAVVVGLWCESGTLHELCLAHLCQACPYLLPLYCDRTPSQSTDDYYKLVTRARVKARVKVTVNFRVIFRARMRFRVRVRARVKVRVRVRVKVNQGIYD